MGSGGRLARHAASATGGGGTAPPYSAHCQEYSAALPSLPWDSAAVKMLPTPLLNLTRVQSYNDKTA